MIDLAMYFAFGCLGLSAFFTVFRVVKAPNLCDRILALDTLVVNTIGLIVLWGIYIEAQIYFEAALVFAALGFVSTVAYAKFLLRGDIIE